MIIECTRYRSELTHTHAHTTHPFFFPSPNCPPPPTTPTPLHFTPSLALSFTFLFIRSPVSLPLFSRILLSFPTSRLSLPLTSLLTMRSIYLSVIPPLLFPFYFLSRSVDPPSLSSPPPPPPTPHHLPFPVSLLSLLRCSGFWSASVLDRKSLPLTPHLPLTLPPHLSPSLFSMQQGTQPLTSLSTSPPVPPVLPLYPHFLWSVCSPCNKGSSAFCLSRFECVYEAAPSLAWELCNTAETEPTVGCIMVNNTMMYEGM